MPVDEEISVVTGESVLHGSLSGRTYYRSLWGKIDILVKKRSYPQELTFRIWTEADVREPTNGVSVSYCHSFGGRTPGERSSGILGYVCELYEELDTYYGPAGGGIVRLTIPLGIGMVSLRDPIGDTVSETLNPNYRNPYFYAVSDISIDKPSASKVPVVRTTMVMSAPIGATINVDVRVVRVSDGKVVASATQGNAYGRLPRLTRELAEQLKSGIATRGASIAVTDFLNRGDSAVGAAVVKEVVDKLSGALVQTGWFNVKERVSLGKLIDERDLGLAGIVKTPEAKAKLGNVDYLVIGGITITGVSR
jgi:hypothetical protein